MKLKKNDNVLVLKGKDRGASGKVLAVFPEVSKVVEKGTYASPTHSRTPPRREGTGCVCGRAYSVANVALVCGKCKKERASDTSSPSREGACVPQMWN